MSDTKQITTIDDYINDQPEAVRPLLAKIREAILEEVPDATETIAYNMPAFKLNGTRFIYFAAWKKHIGLYPIYGASKLLSEELKPYKQEKDSVHLPITEPFPYDLLKKIVRMKADLVEQE